MKKELIIISNQIEQDILRDLNYLSKILDNIYKRKFIYIDFEKSDNYKLDSYGNDFIFSSSLREIKIIVNINYNKKERVWGIGVDFWIKNLKPKEDERENFRLKDYCTFRKIHFPERFESGFAIDENENICFSVIEPFLKEYFQFIKKIISIEEVKKMLYSEYWTNVPIDYSPYK